MGNMTLAIPDNLQRKMAKRTEVRWSNIARETFEAKVKELDFMDRLLGSSEFTEGDAEAIGHNVKAEIRKRFEKRFGKWS